jgi:hypothetical protein
VRFGVAAKYGNGHGAREPGGHAQTGQERRAEQPAILQTLAKINRIEKSLLLRKLEHTSGKDTV